MEDTENTENVISYKGEQLVYKRGKSRKIVLESASDYLEFNELLKKELNTYRERRISDIDEIILLVKNVLSITCEDANLESLNYSNDKVLVIDYSFNLEKSQIHLALIKDSEICKKTISFGKCSGTYICTHKIKNSKLLSMAIPYSNIPGYTINIIY